MLDLMAYHVTTRDSYCWEEENEEIHHCDEESIFEIQQREQDHGFKCGCRYPCLAIAVETSFFLLLPPLLLCLSPSFPQPKCRTFLGLGLREYLVADDRPNTSKP